MKIQFECPHCGEFEEIEVREGMSEWKCQCGQTVPLKLPQSPRGRPGDDVRSYTPRLKCRNCNNRIFLDPAKPPNYKPSICPECHGEMILRFLCPTCKRKLDSTPDRYGEASACPGCGAKITGGMEIVEYKVPTAEDAITSGVRPGVPDPETVLEAKKQDSTPKPEVKKPKQEHAQKPVAAEPKEPEKKETPKDESQPVPTPVPKTEPMPQPEARPEPKSEPRPKPKPAAEKADGGFGEDFEDGAHVTLSCESCRLPLPTSAKYCPICGKAQGVAQGVPLPAAASETPADDPNLHTFLLPAIGLIMLAGAVVFVLSIYKPDERGAMFSAIALLCGIAALVTCMGMAHLTVSMASIKSPETAGLREKLKTNVGDTYLFSLLFSILSLACMASGLMELANGMAESPRPPASLVSPEPDGGASRNLLSLPRANDRRESDIR
ncbi:MAG TPA: hypothetical protein PL033_18750 [Candidatus Brocadiia bacterium]|nr:hypothetical protein [Candidatus Brocadiia bacterium]